MKYDIFHCSLLWIMYTCIIIRWAANTTEAPKLRENNDNAKGVDGLLHNKASFI